MTRCTDELISLTFQESKLKISKERIETDNLPYFVVTPGMSTYRNVCID